MAAGFLDRRHARDLMREAGLEAIVLAQPESIRYATGAFPGVASFWRRAGAAFIVAPANEDDALAAIVGDLQATAFQAQSGIADVRAHALWVETSARAQGSNGEDIAAELVARDLAHGRALGESRPGTYSLGASLALLRDVLGERGLLKARIGLELGFIPAADFPAFATALPETRFVDCSPLVARLRAIKQPAEIAMLREAAEFSFAGVGALMARLGPGLDAREMTDIWREATRAEARARSRPEPQSDWAYIAVGGDGFAPGVAAKTGDLVKIDVGCVIGGYSSDGGRTAVIGHANHAQRAIFDALRSGFDAGLAMLKPGVALAQVHRAVTRAIHDRGFLTYQRGHFGHGVGASIWSEEWPFIAADCDAIAEPGMTLAFETPYYIAGVGGLIIEDQLLVTEHGVELMAEAPRDLYEAGVGVL